MSFIKFSVRSDLTAQIAEQLSKGARKAEHEIANEVMADTEKYVPALNLSLSDRTRAVGNMVIYPGPYAKYLYYGKLMVDPDTGSSYVKKGAKKVLTDRNLVFNTSVHADAQSHWFEASKAQNMEKWIEKAAKVIANE